MCKIVDLRVGDRVIRVADIKQRYIENIADAARKCDLVDRIVLFGSCTEERCTEESDIDLAIFGNKAKHLAYRSKSYDKFVSQIYQFDFDQDYDLLYFVSGQKQSSSIFRDIENGELIYAKN